MRWAGGENYSSQDHLSILQASDHAFPTPTPTPTPDSEFSSVQFSLLFCHNLYKSKKKLSWRGSPREATKLIRNRLPQLNN